MGQKWKGLLREELGPNLTHRQSRGLLPYQVVSCSIQPFGHNKHGPKVEGAAVPLYVGKLTPHLTQCRLGRAYLCTEWHLDPCSRFVTIDMGRGLRTQVRVKVGAAFPLSVGAAVTNLT